MFDRAWVKRVSGLLVIGWSSLAAAAGGDWHYTIDRPREAQQANFCDSLKSIEEIADIFERFGPRTGYAALSNSPDCATGVRSFTPRKVVTTVTVAKGKPGEYKVWFVEVENAGGDTLYLVTTRAVAPR